MSQEPIAIPKMSTAFTTPTTENFFDTVFRNELVLALSERRQVIGLSAVSPIADGAAACHTGSGAPDFSQAQDFVINYAGVFYDPTYESGDPYPSPAAGSFQHFCQTTCAGTILSSGSDWGFPYKLTADGSLIYPNSSRKDTAGDYSGTHLPEALQAAFANLIVYRPVVFNDNKGESNNKQSGEDDDTDWEAAKTGAESAGVFSQSNFKAWEITYGILNGGDYTASWSSVYLYPLLIAKSLEIGATINWYIEAQPPSSDDVIFDDNGHGFVENVLTYIENQTIVSGNNWGSVIGSTTRLPTWCDEPAVDAADSSRGWEGSILSGIIVNPFTNA